MGSARTCARAARSNGCRRIFAAALELPAKVRAKLAHELLESLDDSDESAEELWLVEIEKRAREVVDGSVELLDFDQVMAEFNALDDW